MRSILASLAFLVLAPPLAAQGGTPPRPDAQLVDRVVAVVGDTVVLLSDLEFDMQQLAASGEPVPTDPAQRAQAARQILESKVQDLVLLEAARAAGVSVSSEELARVVDQEVASARERFGSESALVNALAASGMTMEQYRRMITEQLRSLLTIRDYRSSRAARLARPEVSEAEIERVFEERRSSLGRQPESVTYRQVLVQVRPSEEAKAAARAKAEDILAQLRAGGDFETLARRFSEDPGSREQGGSLGWFRRGRMVPAFEQAVYSLRPGQTSGIVETDFGFHIIRLEKARGGERQARHILIRPETGEADIARAGERADSVASAVRGGASIRDLARQYDTPAEIVEAARVPLDRLPPAVQALQTAQPGEVLAPVQVDGPTGAPVWAVVQLVQRHEPGELTLDDVRDTIRARLQEQKMMEEMLERARETVHVQVML